MTLATVRSALLWCTILNYGVLLLWGVLMLLPHSWLYRITGRFFRVSIEQFDTIQCAGIVLYKLLIFVFNLVPLIALWIVG
jgi:hypothetical protein